MNTRALLAMFCVLSYLNAELLPCYRVVLP